jgi:ABC-type Mn2+/Zn2+ transport system ATPase subunit
MLFIEAIKIEIHTNEKNVYGRFISMTKPNGQINEMNLIFGENTLGKSTLIESIIYALNGEEIYKVRNGNKIIDYEHIFETYFRESIEQAHIFINISNGKEKVVIVRDALNKKEPVKVFKNADLTETVNLDTIYSNCEEFSFYKIEKERNIDGNETYQQFLFSFLGLPPIKKMEDIEEESNRFIFYFQNLMPLFVIHQQAWFDIQAINPRYEVKDIKKLSFEYLMNFSSNDAINKNLLLEKKKLLLNQSKKTVHDIENFIMLLSQKDINKITNLINELMDELKTIEEKIKDIENGNKKESDVINNIRKKYREVAKVYNKNKLSLNLLEDELDEYYYYVNKINRDIEQFDKLKTAKKIIGSIPTNNCPRCLSEITVDKLKEVISNECGLCGSAFKSTNNEAQSDPLKYSKDKLSDFNKLIKNKESQKIDYNNKLFLLEIEMKELKKNLDNFEEQLKPSKLEEYSYYSREVGRINNEIKQLEKDKKRVEEYNVLLESITRTEKEIEQLKAEIQKLKSKQQDEEKRLTYFQQSFKSRLKELDFIKIGISKEYKETEKDNREEIAEKIYREIKIDRDNYLPKLEDRNLYNITSSSGLIRIILAYYVALLETGLHYSEKTNHPLLIILDEPRQQNLDITTFNKFVNIFEKLRKKYKGKFQLIITSSKQGAFKESDKILDLGTSTYLIKKLN